MGCTLHMVWSVWYIICNYLSHLSHQITGGHMGVREQLLSARKWLARGLVKSGVAQEGGRGGFRCSGAAGYPKLDSTLEIPAREQWSDFAVSYCLCWPIPANRPAVQFWVSSGTRAVIATSDSSWANWSLLLLMTSAPSAQLACNTRAMVACVRVVSYGRNRSEDSQNGQ